MRFLMLVLSPADTENVFEHVETLLAPYENEEWDWWQLGGRWAGEPTLSVADLTEDHVPFGVITPDGVWHVRGEHHPRWDDEELGVWAKRFRTIVAPYPSHLAVACDLHI